MKKEKKKLRLLGMYDDDLYTEKTEKLKEIDPNLTEVFNGYFIIDALDLGFNQKSLGVLVENTSEGFTCSSYVGSSTSIKTTLRIYDLCLTEKELSKLILKKGEINEILLNHFKENLIKEATC